MLRILIILAGALVGYSAYQSPPDVQGLLDQYREAPEVLQAKEFVSNWQFAAGAGAGLIAGEILRVLWRYTKIATEFASVIGGRAIQYAALASLAGIIIYFI
ncbi:MAG: hypothetical protein RLZ98_927 [Pseudomonadota bacterium]|jgi:hypothetical protein